MLWRPILLITIFLLHQPVAAAEAENNGNCPPSSCGEIHGIIYPFRLDTDPPNCGFSSFAGDKNFTLSCHNNSSLFWYLNNDGSGRFLVKGINYDNFTIHLVDPAVQPNNCSSLPISPISSSFYPNPYYRTDLSRRTRDTYLSRTAVLINCDRKQVNYSPSEINKSDPYFPYFVEVTAPCKTKTRSYSYVILWGRSFSVSFEDVMESCSIDMITLLPYTVKKLTSYQEVHTQFSHGFHLSWFNVFCQQNCSGYQDCYLDEENLPTCANPYTYPITTYYQVRTWYLFIYGTYLAPRTYWGPIFKITGSLITILTPYGPMGYYVW